MSIISLYTAASALKAHQQYLGIVANNLANVNTVGYKGARALFSDTISQQLRPPTLPSATNPGANGAQIGLGTQIGAIGVLFNQGGLQATGLSTDLAVEGNGFFVVKNPSTSALFYTRAGNFSVDTNGNLTTITGERVQGGADGAVDGDALIDITVPADVGGVKVVSFNIDALGRVNALLEDGTNAVVASLTLEKFNNNEGLVRAGSNLFQATPSAGPVFGAFQTVGAGGLGNLRAGFLELSNIDLGNEFSEIIRAQRGLQANARVITTSDEVIQELVNLKR